MCICSTIKISQHILCILYMCGVLCVLELFLNLNTICLFFIFRILGLCLLQNELCPITLNRHVIKVLLGRKVSDFNEPNCFYIAKNLFHKIIIYIALN